MATRAKNGSCEVALSFNGEGRPTLCGADGTWRERETKGVKFGYYSCDEHWEHILRENPLES